MPNDLVEAIDRTTVETLFLLLSLSMLRPIGLLFGFMPFTWGLGNSFTIRAAIGIALAMPTMIVSYGPVVEFSETASRMDIMFLSPKEFILGYAIGLLLSLPFFVLQYSGAVVDAFRGEQDSGLQSPSDGSLATSSLLFLIIGIMIFVTANGFAEILTLFYDSYKIWPVHLGLPVLNAASSAIVLDLVITLLWYALLLASPILAVLMIVEVGLAVSTKFGRRFNLYEISFLLRNLVFLFLIPIFAVILIRYLDSDLVFSTNPLNVLDLLMP